MIGCVIFFRITCALIYVRLFAGMEKLDLEGDGYKLFLSDGCELLSDDEISDQDIVGNETLTIARQAPGKRESTRVLQKSRSSTSIGSDVTPDSSEKEGECKKQPHTQLLTLTLHSNSNFHGLPTGHPGPPSNSNK